MAFASIIIGAVDCLVALGMVAAAPQWAMVIGMVALSHLVLGPALAVLDS